ncbi:MAG TPA: DEAD/DEAH box helicase [Steroidobacteraceae bacterium]|nr:DEAD/DEAH box helicase [Steroidobacteraceae bacterium]
MPGMRGRVIALRPYQLKAIEQLDAAIAAGKRAPLLVVPTGGGKTVIASRLIERIVERGGSALFIAPRRELVTQASRQLARIGIGHGVLLAGADAEGGLYSNIQVASIDTLLSRIVRRQRLQPFPIQLIIVDEAHLSITATRRSLLELWPEALRIGLTATPTRKDGKALGLLYDQLIEPVTVADLVLDGFLVPARYFSVSEPDLKRVRTVAGDYHQAELERAVNRPELVGDVVAHWLKHAATRRSVVFATSIKHSVALCEEFLRSGVAAEHVDADTPQAFRDATFERFRAGATQVLTNCFLASYGFDLPELSCVVLARPTKSLMLYLQMIGRGLRTAESKSDCLVLDHSGCVHRFGFAHDERQWTLEGEQALVQQENSEPERREAKQLTCPECSCVFGGARLCPECGYFFAPKGKEIRTLEGELVEIGEALTRELQDRAAFYAELRGVAAERHWKPTAAACQFKERYGDWPPRAWNSMPIAEPSIETRRWVQSRMIAWRKSRDGAGRAA